MPFPCARAAALGRLFAGLLLAFPLGAQAPFEPALRPDGWTRSTPEAAGFDGDRLQAELAQLMDGRLNLHGVVVARQGRLVAEAYRRGPDHPQFTLFRRTVTFGPEVVHDTRSVGKTVIALLVGVAQAQGRLGSLDTPVLDFFPELAGRVPPARRRITLAHLLGMSTGLRWREAGVGFPNDEDRLAWKASPVAFLLGREAVAEPGTTFTYCSGATVALAEVLTRVMGRPWTEVARTELFQPLGITDVTWVTDLRGRPMPNSGLRLRPRDLAKLGRLLLEGGRWEGRPLVPAAWIEALGRPRLPTGFEGTRYGLHLWTGTVRWQDRELPWQAAFGNGGQRVYVVPALDLTVVTTGGAYGDLATARALQGAFQRLVACVRRP